MLKSMTGFGKATKEINNKTITVEIRSLNSKNVDLSLRMSSIYRDKELELRNELSKLLERGKVDLSVYVESKTIETPVEINLDLAKAYYAKLKLLANELGESDNDLLKHIIKLPDVLKSERREFDESEWTTIRETITEALNALNKFRDDEGQSITKDFTDRLNIITSCLEKIIELDKNRITSIKERIRNNVLDAVGKTQFDNNRFEQELIY